MWFAHSPRNAFHVDASRTRARRFVLYPKFSSKSSIEFGEFTDQRLRIVGGGSPSPPAAPEVLEQESQHLEVASLHQVKQPFKVWMFVQDVLRFFHVPQALLGLCDRQSDAFFDRRHPS